MLIEMTSLGEGGCDLAQAHALAGLGACPVQALGQGDGLGAQLPMRLAPFTLPLLLANALGRAAAWRPDGLSRTRQRLQRSGASSSASGRRFAGFGSLAFFFFGGVLRKRIGGSDHRHGRSTNRAAAPRSENRIATDRDTPSAEAPDL